jgi:hypothetical protein
MRIHDLDDHAEAILAAYVELSRDATVSTRRLDQAYQLFLSQRMSGGSEGNPIPFTLTPERPTEAPGDFAIEELMEFSTAYDGITALWDALREKPGFDLESRFVRWPLVQRCFLVSGFKDKASVENTTWADARIERLETLIRSPHSDPESDAKKLQQRLERIKGEVGRVQTLHRPQTPRLQIAQVRSSSS